MKPSSSLGTYIIVCQASSRSGETVSMGLCISIPAAVLDIKAQYL